jgi:ribosomal protein S17E
MGSIKQKFIKRIGKALMEKDAERFTPEFDHNKKELQQMINDGTLNSPSKMVRNKLAGFVSRKVLIAKGLNIKKKPDMYGE